jgi:hypothetical protein
MSHLFPGPLFLVPVLDACSPSSPVANLETYLATLGRSAPDRLPASLLVRREATLLTGKEETL